MGSQQKTASSAGRIVNRVVGFRTHDFYNCAYQLTWGEVLSSTRFHLFGVLLQKPFVEVAFHVGVQVRPLSPV